MWDEKQTKADNIIEESITEEIITEEIITVWVNEPGYQYDIHSLIKSFYPHGRIEIVTEEFDEGWNEHPQNEDRPKQSVLLEILFWSDHMRVRAWNGHVQCYEGQDKISHELKRVEVKNRFKRMIYQALSNMTGRVLPWGTLTGIRPVKLPMAMLEEGKSKDEIADYMRETYYCSDEKIELAMAVAHREKMLLDGIPDIEDGYSLYVGIPFCPSICLYCSFSSYPLEKWENRLKDYIDALFLELDYIKEACFHRTLHTIYIGGGTPTTLTADLLHALLSKIENDFDLSQLMEFTVEAGRPDSITREKLQVIRNHKVTRISINPQTMNQKTLDVIGRKHTTEQIVESFHLARELGFDNINMDLIVGLPGETKEDVAYTLNCIKDLSPDSVTIHSLAIKRAARLNLFKESYEKLGMENSQGIMKLTADVCREMGMNPYYLYRQKNMAGNLENVGYAREGKEGIYNILIMEERQTIMAAGAGASTKFVYPHNRIERVENVKDVGQYIDRISEMIQRKKEKKPDDDFLLELLEEDVTDELFHGMRVSYLAFELGKRLGLSYEQAKELSIAGLLHDIGKLRLSKHLYGRDESSMQIEEMKYMHTHSRIGYDILIRHDYSDFILETILYHHENYDGTGYPRNLEATDIPYGARMLHVVDTYCALTQDRPYRKAFDSDTAVKMMIDEVKNYDMRYFLVFLEMIHVIDMTKLINEPDFIVKIEEEKL